MTTLSVRKKSFRNLRRKPRKFWMKKTKLLMRRTKRSMRKRKKKFKRKKKIILMLINLRMVLRSQLARFKYTRNVTLVIVNCVSSMNPNHNKKKSHHLPPKIHLISRRRMSRQRDSPKRNTREKLRNPRM